MPDWPIGGFAEIAAKQRSTNDGVTIHRRRWGRTSAGEYAFVVVTAKEELLQRAPNWSEEQAERALRAAESDGVVDGWGDLSKLHEVSTAETLRRLAEEEEAAGHEPW